MFLELAIADAYGAGFEKRRRAALTAIVSCQDLRSVLEQLT
ncbi:hypothetical protein [Oleiphilus messinensis]|nr:hypothetical protein [Oleiphilus messinensis]